MSDDFEILSNAQFFGSGILKYWKMEAIKIGGKFANFAIKGIMRNIEMTAVFEPCDEGGYIAYVQEIPGINTQGETLDEAKENLADAVNLVFEEMRATNRKDKANKMITQTMSFSF